MSSFSKAILWRIWKFKGYGYDIIKQLLKINNLNDPYSGGMSSYALTLMIVSFFQYQIIQMTQTSWHYDQSSDLANSLFQFFNFFGNNIDFSQTTFYPCNPYWRNNSLMNSFDHYPIFMRMPPSTDPLLIIDPLNPQNNVGKSSFKISEIKSWFEKAYSDINAALSNSTEGYKSRFLQTFNLDLE